MAALGRAPIPEQVTETLPGQVGLRGPPEPHGIMGVVGPGRKPPGVLGLEEGWGAEGEHLVSTPVPPSQTEGLGLCLCSSLESQDNPLLTWPTAVSHSFSKSYLQSCAHILPSQEAIRDDSSSSHRSNNNTSVHTCEVLCSMGMSQAV